MHLFGTVMKHRVILYTCIDLWPTCMFRVIGLEITNKSNSPKSKKNVNSVNSLQKQVI